MKKLFYILIITLFSFNAHSQDGHNGIRFDMNQKQVEEKGFVCNPPKEKRSNMDMTGVAFGIPTKDYEVHIGADNKADIILAELVGIQELPDLFSLYRKVENFFPNENPDDTHTEPNLFIRKSWKAKNNSGATIFIMQGIKNFTKTKVSVIFYSPQYNAASEKERAELADKKAKEKMTEKLQ